MIYYSKNSKIAHQYSSCEPNGYTYVDGYGFAPPPPVLTERRLLQWYANGIGFSVLSYFLLSYIVPFFLVAILSVFKPAVRILGNQVVASATAYQLMSLLNGLISLLIPFFMFVLICRIPMKVAFPFRRFSPSLCVLGTGLSLGVMVIGSFSSTLLTALIGTVGLTPQMPDLSMPSSVSAILLYVFQMVIFSPIAEELVFRGIILNTMRRFGDSFALLISAVLFSLFHGNLLQIPNAFLQGLLIGYFVLCTGSLWVGVIIHMVSNGTVLLFDLLTKNLPPELNYLSGLFLFAVFLLISIGSLLVLVKRHPNMFMFIRSSTYASEKSKYKTFFSAITMLVGLIVLLSNVFQHIAQI